MRISFTFLLLTCLAAAGCGKGGTSAETKSGAASGASAEAPPSIKKRPQETRPATPPGVEVVPVPVTLKQGETKAIKANIKREGGYNKEITIEFEPGSTGLTIPTVTVPASQEEKQEVEIRVTAAKDAMGGLVDFTVKGVGLEPKPGMFQIPVVRERKKK